MPYVVMTAPSRAPIHRNRRKNYKRVAVVETDLPFGELPPLIAPGHGCVRVVETWDNLYVGKTRDSQYFKALDDARELVERLTVKEAIAHKRQRLAEARRP